MTVQDRQNLLDQARTIRLEKQVWANTPARVGKFLEDISDSVPLVGGSSVQWHVDDIDGNDANAGTTQGTALKTLAALKLRIATLQLPGTKTTIYLYEHSEPEGYDVQDFAAVLPIIHGDFEVVGVGTRVIAGPFTLTELVSGNQSHLRFGDPGWIPKQWSGYDLECISSPIADVVGARKTILYNDTTTLYTESFWQIDDDNVWQGPAPVGSTFSIVEPAVKINTTANEGTSAWWVEKAPVIQGGVGKHDTFRASGSVTGGVLRLFNVEFRLPDGAVRGPIFSGCLDLFGVHVTSDAAGEPTVFFNSASWWAGGREGDGAGKTYGYGHGFSTRSRNPSRPRPRVWATHSMSHWNIILSTGPILVEHGALLVGAYGFMADMTNWSANYPHSAVHAGKGGRIVFSRNDENRRVFVYSVSGAYDFEAQGGTIESGAELQHVGVGSFARSRDLAHMRFDDGKAPRIWNGTGAAPNVGAGVQTGLRAHYGGQIRLVGWDGSAVGNAIAGQVSQTSRDLITSPLAVNSSVDGSESSHIYRSG